MTRARFNLVSIASLVLVAVVILLLFANGRPKLLKDSLSHKYERATVRDIPDSLRIKHKAEMAALNEAKVNQENPRLVQLIRDYYIEPPSDKNYHLKNPSILDKSEGQSMYVDKRLNAKTGGFFVECGAFDGDFLSNSMFFERARNWTGVLIEADPVTYQMLKTKNRKAYTLNACLSTKPYPIMVTFSRADVFGRMDEDDEQKAWVEHQQKRKKEKVQVQCFPLTSILLALGRTSVDYFSLDIEGDELKVLKTIPMKKININTMSVEVTDKTKASSDLTAYLATVGYERLTHMTAFHMRDTIYGKI